MFQIVKLKGNPFSLLGNNLDLLRETGLDNDTLEIIAIYLIFAHTSVPLKSGPY
jgi:hypothetical protein